MADFLDKVSVMIFLNLGCIVDEGQAVQRESFSEHADRINVLHTLSLLARSAQVFPERLKLSGIKCEFGSHQSLRGNIYKGAFAEGHVVCVKVIPGNATGDTYKQLFKVCIALSPHLQGLTVISPQTHAKEAILSAHMIHQNILPFYGVCDLSDRELKRICIVSAWMDHGNLLQYLEKTSNPPLELLVRFIIHPLEVFPCLHSTHVPQMSDIISGLAYMHGLNIIHSDLQAVAYNCIFPICRSG
jgi:serine/threonine protein kinase